jgi:hypothetical protein
VIDDPVAGWPSRRAHLFLGDTRARARSRSGQSRAGCRADECPSGHRDAAIRVNSPDGVSTEVHVVLVYDIPGGAVGKAVAKYFGEEPHQQLDDDLRRLKQVLETGEVVRSDGAPWGKRARKEFPQRPAQPLSDSELEKGADA